MKMCFYFTVHEKGSLKPLIILIIRQFLPPNVKIDSIYILLEVESLENGIYLALKQEFPSTPL